MTPTRRQLLRCAPVGTLLVLLPSAHVRASITQQDALAGIRQALERGAIAAVETLGVTDGFLGNPKVRIGLPDTLRQLRAAAGFLGYTEQLEALEVGMNRAAEAAVPQAKALLVDAARRVTARDALDILRGGDDSVTQYFKGSAGGAITERFLPIVARHVNKLGLAQRYDKLIGQVARLGLVKPEQAGLDRYVTGRAVDGLFLMIAEKERALRADPLGAGSALLKRVFGGL